ncbi:MAG: glycoside hydrolase [Myxococcales bacterium]|nr:glycoside hydrolase [Myxococcales bacterium]
MPARWSRGGRPSTISPTLRSSSNRRVIRSALLVIVALQQAARAAPGPAPFQRGVCYAHTWRDGGRDGYGSEASAKTLGRLRALGVEWLSLTPFGFMESPSSTAIEVTQRAGTESDARLMVEAKRAHALGMKVALKPHLWIHRGEWQGALTWKDDEAYRRWFASYREFVRRYALLAERAGFDLFVIGTELKTATARDPAAWRRLAGEVRAIYRGPITYAANWDEASGVGFWDALDFIGVQAYMPVTPRRGASVDELRAGWRKIATDLAALSARAGRPIVVTEIGYRATRDAATAPATWPENDPDPRFDPGHQAACYRAALEALWGQPWLAGIYIWKWFTDSRDEQGPTDFSPAGKQAEGVLGEFYRKPKAGSRPTTVRGPPPKSP